MNLYHITECDYSGHIIADTIEEVISMIRKSWDIGVNHYLLYYDDFDFMTHKVSAVDGNIEYNFVIKESKIDNLPYWINK